MLITSFKVTAVCRNINSESEESYNDKKIDLFLNGKDAMMILFKFAPNVFKLSNGMTMYFKFKNDPDNNLFAMILADLDGEKYIVTNPQMIWTDVLEAYEQIRLVNKIELLSTLISEDEVEEEDE